MTLLCTKYQSNLLVTGHTSESAHWVSAATAATVDRPDDRCPLELNDDDRVGVEGAPSSLTSSCADPCSILRLKSRCSTTVSYSAGISSYTWVVVTQYGREFRSNVMNVTTYELLTA